MHTRSQRQSGARQRGVGRLGGLLLLTLACAEPDAPRAPDLAAPWQSGSSRPNAGAWFYEDRGAPLEPGARHVIWFGHSLLVTAQGFGGADQPALDLPGLVAALHRAARASGRSAVPEGRSITFAEGPHGYDYWLDGAGHAGTKLASAARSGVPWTHVVGIGLLHLLGPRQFTFPNLFEWLRVLGRDRPTLRRHTRDEYRMMGVARRALPDATWVHYIGPTLAYQAEVQPKIDGRFRCIESRARSAGLQLELAPVGAAFRLATEWAAGERVALRLRQDDQLHLRPHGALLAAQVLYLTLYGVDPEGLPPPAALARALANTAREQQRVADFLARAARAALIATRRAAQTAERRCAEADALPEDARAAAWLTKTR